MVNHRPPLRFSKRNRHPHVKQREKSFWATASPMPSFLFVGKPASDGAERCARTTRIAHEQSTGG